VFDGNATDNGFSGLDGDLIGTFRDEDGSVYSANSQIVKDLPFHMTPNCVQRSNWKMMPCGDTFGQVNSRYFYCFQSFSSGIKKTNANGLIDHTLC
jgi:hypothetical protein